MKNYLTFCFLLFASISFSQTNIKGKLIDAETKKAISNVEITIKKGIFKQATVSDENGYFSFLEIAPGKYEVVCEKFGYLFPYYCDFIVFEGKENHLTSFGYLTTGHICCCASWEIPLVFQDQTTQGFIFSASQLHRLPYR